jgi:hypothetical protein
MGVGIQERGVKKTPDPGSGSATLDYSYRLRLQKHLNWKYKYQKSFWNEIFITCIVFLLFLQYSLYK